MNESRKLNGNKTWGLSRSEDSLSDSEDKISSWPKLSLISKFTFIV